MRELISEDDLKNLRDENLIELLFTEKDELPRIVIDEFVFGGGRVLGGGGYGNGGKCGDF